MELDRADARILAAIVFMIVFFVFVAVSTVFFLFIGFYFNLITILGGGSSWLDLFFIGLIMLSARGAYLLANKTYMAVLNNPGLFG